MTPRMSRAIRRRLPDHVPRSGVQSMTICRRSSPSGETVLLNVLACVLGLIALVVLFAKTIGF
jgi:hypothetical protein